MTQTKFHIITLFPEMFSALEYGIVGRAQKEKLFQLFFYNPRDFTQDKNKRVDDKPYGGGPGMVMQVQPLRDAIKSAKQNCSAHTKTIYLSPQGKLITQQQIKLFSQTQNLILVSGRYEGIDERIIQNDIDEEWSIGDYVLSGGELPAMVLIDAIIRLHPQALGDPESALYESFTEGLLEYPQYTRPEIYEHQKVPDVLLSGDHEAIQQWRLAQSLGKTWAKRPDLLKDRSLNPEETVLLKNFVENSKE